MTPATKTRPKAKAKTDDPLAIVADYEHDWAEARDEADEAGNDAHQGETRYNDLLAQRQQLVHNDPELVDEYGNPVSSTSPVAKLDAELGKVGLDSLRAKYAHAREIERAKRQRFEQQVRNNGDAIDADLQAKGEAIRARRRAEAEGLVVVDQDWVAHEQRKMEIAHILGRDSHGIPIDQASEALKASRALADSDVNV